MSKPLDLPEPDICDMNCFFKPGHDGPHQFNQPHPDYDACSCKDTWEHREAVKVSDKIFGKDIRITFPVTKITMDAVTYQKPIKVYQCGPMANCTDGEMHEWRESLKKDFPQVTWLDPCDRTYNMQQWRSLVNDDIADIDNADYVLAYYWKTGTGSAMELSYNYYVAKKPSIVVVPGFKAVSPWLRFHADYLVDSFDHAMKIILNNDDTKF